MRSNWMWRLLVLGACASCEGSVFYTAKDAAAEGGAAAAEPSDAAGPRDAHSADAARADAEAGPARDARPPDLPEASTDAGTASDANMPAGRDAASERAYSTTRSEFFGAPRCELDTFLLCEDFESEAEGAVADPDVWQTLDDRITVEATHVARGARALHVITRSLESTHFIRTTKLAPATKLWGRLFFRVETPRPSAFSHWTVIEGTGVHPLGGTARVRFGGIHIPNVENRLDFNYDIWGGRPAGFHEVGHELEGQDTADGVWHCLEWLFDVPQREARLFRDGVEEAGLYASQSIDGITLDFPTLDGLNVGMAIYQDIGSSSWDVWVDEIAVDNKRIGCSN